MQYTEGQAAGIDEPTQLSVKVLLRNSKPSRKRRSLLIDIALPGLQAGNDDYAASGFARVSLIVPMRPNPYQLGRTAGRNKGIRLESSYGVAEQRNREA